MPVSEGEVEQLIKGWYRRSFGQAMDGLTPDCAPLLRLWRHLAEGEALGRYESHVEGCDRCRRALQVIVRQRGESAVAVGVERETGVVATGKTPGRSRWMTPPLLKIAGLAVAASVVIGVLLLWSSFGESRALGQDLREIGFAKPLGMAGLWPDLTDEAAMRLAEDAAEKARGELEWALAGGSTALDPWIPWTTLYRSLRSLGRWEEALAEAEAFLAYAEQRDRPSERFTMYPTALSDVGDLYQAVGDYETALSYHKQSLAVCREQLEWLFATVRSDAATPHALQRELAGALSPRLWALANLSAAMEDQAAAWAYLNQAEELLLDYFRRECQYRGIEAASALEERSAGDGAAGRILRLHALCKAVVADGDFRVKQMTVKVREHLLYRARLLRVDREVAAAVEMLRLSAELPDHPPQDESRLDFNEPMEQLRLAIARSDFLAALTFADEAQQHTGARSWPGRPMHTPIGVIARAELRFLRGVALAGGDPGDPDALRMIESAIDTVDESATSLPETQRQRLLKRLGDWGRVAHRIQGEVFSRREAL